MRNFALLTLLLSVACGTAVIVEPAADPGPAPAPDTNRPPAITRLASSSALVPTGGAADPSGLVAAPDGDPVSVDWSASAGTLTATGLSARWLAPQRAGEATITVTARDPHGGAATRTLTLAIEGGCGRILVDASEGRRRLVVPSGRPLPRK